MEAATVAGRAAGEDLLGEAQRRAPVEEGTLRASGDLDVDVGPGGVIVTVAFNTVYAARQHEETEWEHPKGGEAKYLENPLRERLPRYTRLAELELARRLR
jgi:hypothetical protein